MKISELQAQLVITENSYQEMLKQKFNVEDEKASLINELARIKTLNDDKIRLLESEISFFKARESEVASLRLHLAKLVRASNHLVNEAELADAIPSLSKSSDSLPKKVTSTKRANSVCAYYYTLTLPNKINLSLSLSFQQNNNEKRNIVSYKPPIVPRNSHLIHAQSQFKDSSLTGSFTAGSFSMPSPSFSASKSHHPNTSLQNQFLVKSSTPLLNERCLSPVNRLDLATSKEQLEQLEEFCKRDNSSPHYLDSKPFQSITSPSNPFNCFGQFANAPSFINQSPNSTCSTPNRSAKSSSSASANNSLPGKSGNFLLDKLFANYQSLHNKPASKSHDQISLNDNVSLSSADPNGLAHSLNSRNDSFGSNFLSSGSNFVSNGLNAGSNTGSNAGSHAGSNAGSTHAYQLPANFAPLQTSQTTNSFTSLSLSSNSSSVFGGSIRDVGLRSRPVSFSFSSNHRTTGGRTNPIRNPFSWFRRTSRGFSSSAPELGDLSFD